MDHECHEWVTNGTMEKKKRDCGCDEWDEFHEYKLRVNHRGHRGRKDEKEEAKESREGAGLRKLSHADEHR